MSAQSGSRKCHIVKKQSEEFEFFLTSDEDRHGQIITSVTKGGPASRGGLKNGDRIVEINGVNVEKKDHADVVSIIRDCIPTNEIKFVVIDQENDPNVVKTERPVRQSSKTEPRPRLCKIKKKNNTFGFFLERDAKGDFIKKITPGSASDGTGLKQNDRLIAVGKKNVEKLTHKQVVELIKAAGNKISLLVIDDEGYDHCKVHNITITEKMVQGASSSRSSSSSSSKSLKKTGSTKSKQQSMKESVKSKINLNPHKGKVRIVHLLKHPSNGYGFYMKTQSTTPGEYIGKIDADSSAELAGLYEGDRVLAVNGKSVMDMSHSDVISLIKTKNTQVVVIVLDQLAMKHFEEKDEYPEKDDIVLTYNPAIRTVKLTKGSEGYGMFLKVEKGRPSFHLLTDVNENGVAGKAGLKNGEILLAVDGKGVLKDNHEACVQKIRDAGDSVALTVGSTGTCEFVLKSKVDVTVDLVKEWPTEQEFEVPAFGKTPKKIEEAAKVVIEANATQDNEGLGMKPRLCHVVRGPKGYGFVLKEGQGHFLINIEDKSPAFQAGILEYDRIVEVNSENVDKLGHSELVGKIKASGNEVTFLVVNKEEDTFFKEKGILISSALLEVEDDLSDEHKPRLCKLVRKSGGYGFHLTGEAGQQGQFIKDVQSGSAAEEGGLRNGDKIIEVNGSNVTTESHGAIVKKITENKNEVTFLVIDKKGETYYKLKGVKIVATMVAAKEIVEEITEHAQDEEDKKSIGEASAASSVVEAEVHKEPEIDDNAVLETVVAAAAVEHIAEKVEEMREEDGQSAQEDVQSTTVEQITIVASEEDNEDKQEEREEILEDVAKAAAVAAAVIHATDASEKSDDEKDQDEKPEAEELIENIQDEVNARIEASAEEEEEEEEEGIPDSAKVLVAAAVVANAAQEDDAKSQNSSRPSTPKLVEDTILSEETKEAVEEIIDDRADASEDEKENIKEIAAAAVVVANEISDKLSDRGDESDREEEKKEEDPMKVVAAMVHKEILEKSIEKQDSDSEPEAPKEPEKPVEPKPPVAVVVVKATTPPPSISPVIIQKEEPTSPTESPKVAAVVLTANGDIPKFKPTSPPPSNEPKIIWGQKNLRPITKQISVGAAASTDEPKNGDAKPVTTAAKMSTVAALKAELERRHREQQAAVVRNNVKDELTELSKQSGAASKHIAMFGGSVKKTQANGPKKNQWVGEGMSIKIIET